MAFCCRSFTPPAIRNPFGRRSHLARRSGGVLAVLQMRRAPRLCRDHPWKDEKRRVASRSPSTSLLPPLTLRDFKNAASGEFQLCWKWPMEGWWKGECHFRIKTINEEYSEIWKVFSSSSRDMPALLPCAILSRQARGTYKTNCTVHFVSY